FKYVEVIFTLFAGWLFFQEDQSWLASAILSGLVYVIIRKIGTSENPIVIVNYFMWIAMLGGGFFSLFNWVNPVGIEWLLLLSMGLFGFGAQLFMTKGLQIAATNLVTPFKYVEVIFTLFAGWLFFQEDQSWLALLGMGIIIASLIANVLVVEYAK
ncbi:MAG: EamA family transporter, partial [Bacteroidota bacterium]